MRSIGSCSLCSTAVSEATELGDRHLPQRPHQVRQVGEVAVEQARRHAGALCHRSNGDRAEPALAVELGGSMADPLTLLGSLFLGGCGARHRRTLPRLLNMFSKRLDTEPAVSDRRDDQEDRVPGEEHDRLPSAEGAVSEGERDDHGEQAEGEDHRDV